MTEQTSRLSIVVDTTNALQRLAQFRQSLRQTSAMASNAGINLQGLSGQAQTLGSSATRTTTQLSGTNNQLLAIARNANNASRGVNGLVNPLSRINDLLSRTQAIISGGMFGLFALSVAKTADTMQDLSSQIMLVTKNEQEQLVVTERLHQMANKNLTDLKSTIGLYTNSARALGNMGKSQEEVLKFTNAVSLAMGVGGKSAQEQASALLQLGQAMQSGVLQGDEFRSLAENAPIMLDLIAEKLGKTRGEVRKMAGEGKITAEIIYDSLSGATDKLQAMFDKMPVTMSQAFGVVKNNYNVFVDNFINKTTGLSGAVAKGLIGIANHFDTIAKVAIAGAGVAFVGLASKVTLTATAFTALKAVMIAHPVLAIATAVLGVSSAFFGLNDVLDTTGTVFMDFFGLVKTGLGGLLDLANAVAFNIANDFKNSNEQSSQGFALFFAGTEKGFTGFLQGVGRVVASATATLAGFFKWIGNGVYQVGRVFTNLVIGIGNLIKTVVNNISNAIQNVLNSAIDKVNGVIESVNSVLAHTPLEVQIKTIARISNFATDYKQSQYLGISGDTLMSNIASYIPHTVGLSDNYFGTVANRQNPQKATADLAKAVGQNTQAVNDNTKSEKGGNKGQGDKKTNKESDKYTYTAKEIEALKRVQGLIYGSDLKRYAEQKGVPVHMLAGLMMQESRGMQYAKSPTGALGYFQTTKAYRQDMGMSREDSFDLIKSGTKAIDYLAQSYKEFGDWNSAILSYNAGRGGTRQFNKTGKVSNNEARNKEVREYVPSIDKWSAWFNGGNGGLGKNQDIAEQGKDYLQQTAEFAKKQQELLLKYETKWIKDQLKLKAELDEIELFVTDKDQKEAMLQLVKDMYEESHIYQQKTNFLELNAYRLSATQKMDMEKELALHKINLNTDSAEQEKNIHRQAIMDKYAFDVEQFSKAQQKMIQEIGRGIDEVKTTGHLNNLMDAMNKKYLSPQQYNLQQLQKTYHHHALDEYKRHSNILEAINETDVSGNHMIENKQERDRLIQEAEKVHQEELLAIRQLYLNESQALEQEALSQRLQSYGGAFGAMSDLLKNYLGEQSGAYRAMFAMSKAFALADIGIKMGQAIGQAWADPSATSWQKMANVAKVVVQQGHLTQMINAINPQGFKMGGYTGNVGVNDVAGVVHGQEYVLNAKATKRIGVDTLNRLNNGNDIGGGQTVIVNVTVNSDGTANVDSQAQMGKQMGEAIKVAVQKEVMKQTRQGGLLYGR